MSESPTTEPNLIDELGKTVSRAFALAEKAVQQAYDAHSPLEAKMNSIYDALQNADVRMATLRIKMRRTNRTAARKAAKAPSSVKAK